MTVGKTSVFVLKQGWNVCIGKIKLQELFRCYVHDYSVLTQWMINRIFAHTISLVFNLEREPTLLWRVHPAVGEGTGAGPLYRGWVSVCTEGDAGQDSWHGEGRRTFLKHTNSPIDFCGFPPYWNCRTMMQLATCYKTCSWRIFFYAYCKFWEYIILHP